MRRCRVSMIGEDGEEHALETEAASLMEAAYAGVQEWARLWWFSPRGVLEVRSGEECWRVTARYWTVRRRERQFLGTLARRPFEGGTSAVGALLPMWLKLPWHKG